MLVDWIVRVFFFPYPTLKKTKIDILNQPITFSVIDAENVFQHNWETVPQMSFPTNISLAQYIY